MADNAEVAWVECEAPWMAERQLIAWLDLPLNLKQNHGHPFHAQLDRIRDEARAVARNLPVVSD